MMTINYCPKCKVNFLGSTILQLNDAGLKEFDKAMKELVNPGVWNQIDPKYIMEFDSKKASEEGLESIFKKENDEEKNTNR